MMMENHGIYDTHSVKLDELQGNKLTTFGSPGSAFSSSFNHPLATQLCCLTEDGSQCKRVAGNASYSKRIQKTVQQKKLRLSIDNSARHVYICDHHKNMIQSVRSCSVKRKRKDSAEDENGNGNNSNDGYSFVTSNDRDHSTINPHDTSLTITTFSTSNNSNIFNNSNHNINHNVNNTSTFITSIGPTIATPITNVNVNNNNINTMTIINNNSSGLGGGIDNESISPSVSVGEHTQVDLSTLQMNTLRRYKRHYRVQTPPGINKSQLAETLLNHFKGIPIDEKEAITYFIYMVKCNRNKIDQMKGLITSNHNLPYSGSSSPRHTN